MDSRLEEPEYAHTASRIDKRAFVNRVFAAFTASLGLNMQFAAPAKINENGGVEGAQGNIEDNFLRPLLNAATLTHSMIA